MRSAEKYVYAWIYRPSRCDWVRAYVTLREALIMQQPGRCLRPGTLSLTRACSSMAERGAHNAVVGGSIPSAPTTNVYELPVTYLNHIALV